jgi:hypothetical protein
MKMFILTAVASIALSATGAFAKGYSPELNDLARTSSVITVHGVFDAK